MILGRLAWALASRDDWRFRSYTCQGTCFGYLSVLVPSSCLCTSSQYLLYRNDVDQQQLSVLVIQHLRESCTPPTLATVCLRSFRDKTISRQPRARNIWKKAALVSFWASQAHSRALRSSWSCSDYMYEHACFISSGPTTGR